MIRRFALSLMVVLVMMAWAGPIRAETTNEGQPELVRLILAPQEDGWIGIESASFTNTGSEPLARLVAPIPPGAQEVEYVQGDGTAVQMRPDGNLMVDAVPLPPGESRNLIFSFTLPPEPGELAIPFPHGVAAVVVMVPDGVQVVSGQLQPAAPVDLNGRLFRRFVTLRPLEPGQKLKLEVSALVRGESGVATDGNTGAPGIGEQPGSLGHSGDDPRQVIGHAHGGTPLKVVINFGFILLAFALAIWGSTRAGRRLLLRSRPSRGVLPDRATMVRRIAALDLDYQDGRVSEQAYRERRTALKEQLLTATAAAQAEVR